MRVLHIWVLEFSLSPVAYAKPVSGITEYTEFLITTAEKRKINLLLYVSLFTHTHTYKHTLSCKLIKTKAEWLRFISQ